MSIAILSLLCSKTLFFFSSHANIKAKISPARIKYIGIRSIRIIATYEIILLNQGTTNGLKTIKTVAKNPEATNKISKRSEFNFRKRSTK